jgi:tripartite-type tricarboxylate transporter receptor subunit TctC
MNRRLAIALAGAALSVGLPLHAAAQAYPSKTVTLIVPYAAGGATDTVARTYADALRKETQQTFIVDNKPGANGLIAMEYVSRASKDGTVILVGNPATNALLPVTGKAKFDIEKAFLPVARLATVPGVLVATRSLPVRNVKELVDHVRKNPGRVSYASAGSGSLAHLNFLALAEQAGIDMIHVPYKGGPQALTDNLAGLVHLNFLNLSNALPSPGPSAWSSCRVYPPWRSRASGSPAGITGKASFYPPARRRTSSPAWPPSRRRRARTRSCKRSSSPPA